MPDFDRLSGADARIQYRETASAYTAASFSTLDEVGDINEPDETVTTAVVTRGDKNESEYPLHSRKSLSFEMKPAFGSAGLALLKAAKRDGKPLDIRIVEGDPAVAGNPYIRMPMIVKKLDKKLGLTDVIIYDVELVKTRTATAGQNAVVEGTTT